VHPRAGLDDRKFLPHWDSIPLPSSRYRVAIPTELSRPVFLTHIYIYIYIRVNIHIYMYIMPSLVYDALM